MHRPAFFLSAAFAGSLSGSMAVLFPLRFQGKYSDFHIFQGQALQTDRPLFFHSERHQGRYRFYQAVTGRRRHFIALAGGTGSRVGTSAGTEDDSVARHGPAVFSQDACDPGSLADRSLFLFGGTGFLRRRISGQGFCHDPADLGIIQDPDPHLPQMICQCFGHIRRVIGNRKRPFASFDLDPAAPAFEIVYDRCGIKGIDTAVEKFGIGYHILEEFLRITGIGQVAAPLPGDIDLLPRLLIFLHDRNPAALSGRSRGCHQAGRACPDDHDMCLFLFILCHGSAPLQS